LWNNTEIKMVFLQKMKKIKRGWGLGEVFSVNSF